MELVFEEIQPEIEQSRWGKVVPIVEKDGIVTAYIMGEVVNVEEYNELCYTLENTKAKEVRLIINNGGGQLSSMLSIITSIGKCQCPVVGVLSGTVASAATMIALECDKLEVAPYTSWLTHTYSGGLAGKGNEIEAQYEFEKKHIPNIFKGIHKGFLTTAEINRVLKGKDMWMDKDEIEKRFAKMKASKANNE